jgi:hypothetical protein
MPVANSIAFFSRPDPAHDQRPKGKERDHPDRKDHRHGDRPGQTFATDHWDARGNRLSLDQPDDYVLGDLETDEHDSHNLALNQIRFWRIPAYSAVVSLLYCDHVYSYTYG